LIKYSKETSLSAVDDIQRVLTLALGVSVADIPRYVDLASEFVSRPGSDIVFKCLDRVKR
jgi:hypothetical protein